MFYKSEGSVGFGLKHILAQILAYQFIVTLPRKLRFAVFNIGTETRTSRIATGIKWKKKKKKACVWFRGPFEIYRVI